jgi:phage-related protein
MISFPTLDRYNIRLLRLSQNKSTEYQSVRVQFGGGFTHTRPLGIGTRREEIPVVLFCSVTGYNTVKSFFSTVGTWQPFLFGQRGETPTGHYLNSEVQEEWLSDSRVKLSFTLRNQYV